MIEAVVSISTNNWRNASDILLSEVGYFSHRNWEEATSPYNVIDKTRIIKSEWKHKGPLVLIYALVMQPLYFSQFFTPSYGGLHRICCCSNVHLSIASKLCGWYNQNMKESYTLYTLCTQFSPLHAENCILGLWNFKFQKAACPQTPLEAWN